MRNYDSREKLREIYQREDNGQKTFIPAAEHENSYKIDLADGYITTDKV